MEQSPIIVTDKQTLQKMIEEAVTEAVKPFKQQQEQLSDNDTIPMSDLIKSRKYGSRNTITKLKDEIISDDDVYQTETEGEIFIKRGRRYYFYIKRFDNWFMKRKRIHEEELKIDPRLRGD
ncbi:hypothetical protein [Limosilactobacillus agrestis]|uniref:hypothetical protein n=1 Tax=Limosilactobacillus agrestis TaxID=2759748 RepID=UPI001E394342|nr:hypothetical protein [Limosilactobacillus agrestis]MCD7113467.1 hypothetical protein [Limosilactobacillus agrestis]